MNACEICRDEMWSGWTVHDTVVGLLVAAAILVITWALADWTSRRSVQRDRERRDQMGRDFEANVAKYRSTNIQGGEVEP